MLIAVRQRLRQYGRQALQAGGILFPASHYVLLAILFGVGLELLFALQQWVIGVAIALAAVVTVGIVLVVVEERGSFVPLHAVLPILYVLGALGFAFLLPTTGLLQGYIVGTAAFFFVVLKHAARAAYPVWNWLLTLVTLLLLVGFVLGLRFHLYLPVLLTLALVYIASFLLSLQAYRRVYTSAALALVPAGITALALTELAWLLQFLPSHYLVQASMLTAVYYSVFHLLDLRQRRALTRRDLLEYIGVGGAALGIIVVSARWA